MKSSQLKRKPMKSKPTRRDWRDAIEAVEEEAGCRVCGHPMADAAHIVPRSYDPVKTGPRGGKYLYVEPNNIVALCNSFGNDHHGMFDRGELDLSDYLEAEEWLHAEKVLGEGRARRRITGDKDLLDACYTGLERM